MKKILLASAKKFEKDKIVSCSKLTWKKAEWPFFDPNNQKQEIEEIECEQGQFQIVRIGDKFLVVSHLVRHQSNPKDRHNPYLVHMKMCDTLEDAIGTANSSAGTIM